MEPEARLALTEVGAGRVHTPVLAATVVRLALIHIWMGTGDQGLAASTCLCRQPPLGWSQGPSPPPPRTPPLAPGPGPRLKTLLPGPQLRCTLSPKFTRAGAEQTEGREGPPHPAAC